MAVAGYSQTPLRKKLGIKDETKILLVNAPSDYDKWLESDTSKQLCKSNEVPDLVHLFATSYLNFEKEMFSLRATIKKNPALVIWVSWYKKSAGIKTDISEDMIRAYVLANNLVDIKVCAVTELWSGLKLVVPVAKRTK